MLSIKQIKQDKSNIGVWGPACVQHGFTVYDSFTSDKFRVPSGIGLRLFEAIEKFLEDPNNAPWALDEGMWPTSNEGCNGIMNLKSH